jgi:hypothetical protein
VGLLNKECTRCKNVKPLNSTFFPLHNKTKSGFDSWCKECRKRYRSNIRRGIYRSMIDDESLKEIIRDIKQCVICGAEESLVVDHCHKTNKIRGMLCNHCNRGLGHFKDNPDLLEFARIYLLHNDEASDEVDEYFRKWDC